MMTTLVIMATLMGVALGMRFKMLVLIPAITIGSAVALSVGMADSDMWASLFALMLVVGGLQLGYFAGAAIRFAATGASAGKISPGTAAEQQLGR